jgi:hypothetical protein
MTPVNIGRMMKRLLKIAGLPDEFSPHSFRVTTVTDLLEQNTAFDDGQSYCLLRQFCPGFSVNRLADNASGHRTSFCAESTRVNASRALSSGRCVKSRTALGQFVTTRIDVRQVTPAPGHHDPNPCKPRARSASTSQHVMPRLVTAPNAIRWRGRIRAIFTL